MAIDMVVFDMAGTTVDDSDHAVARAISDALADAGVIAERQQVNPYIGTAKPAALRALLTAGRGGVPPSQAEVDAAHANYQRRIIEHYRTGPNVREMTGATALFATLRAAGVRVTLDTGFDRPSADTIIRRMGWDKGAIDDSVTTDEVARGRPDPEMIHVLMRRAGITDPARVAKVGDSVSDIEQGLAARCGLVVAIMSERSRPVVQKYPGVLAFETLEGLADVILGVTKP